MILYPPVSTVAGTDAVIKFTLVPADAETSNLQLNKLPFDIADGVSGPHPPVNADRTEPDGPSLDPLPVSSDIYHIDLFEGKIVFPAVGVENAGSYVVSCDDDILGAFRLKVIPQESEKKFLEAVKFTEK